MTALLIIVIVFCGLAFLVNLTAYVADIDDDANALAMLNLLPFALAITAMSIALGTL